MFKRMARKALPAAVMLTALLLATAAFTAAAPESGLVLTVKVAREVTVLREGKPEVTLVPVEKVRRGDLLVYTIEYRNADQAELRDALITDPVPNGTAYVLESAAGKNTEITFSVDGGHLFQKPPVKYTVRKPDGTSEERTAPAEMYTHLRWKLTRPLAAGAGGQVSFKARVK